MNTRANLPPDAGARIKSLGDAVIELVNRTETHGIIRLVALVQCVISGARSLGMRDAEIAPFVAAAVPKTRIDPRWCPVCSTLHDGPHCPGST